MTTSEKVGAGVLVGLFFVFIALLYVTLRNPTYSAKQTTNSYFVQQRMVNLNKSN